MVAFLHLPVQLPAYAPFFLTNRIFDTERLKAGVDVFFVISGFIMYVTSRESRPWDFAIRRIIRIVPLYWSLTGLLVVVAVARPALFHSTAVSGEYIFKSLLFIPYSNPTQGGHLAPILVPGWTLNFEMFFYAVFTLILFFPARFHLALSGCVFLLVLAVERALAATIGLSPLSFYDNPQILEFWTGMLIGYTQVHRPIRLPGEACWLLILGGFFLLTASYNLLPPTLLFLKDSIWSYLIPATTIVLGVVALENTRRIRAYAFPLLIGDASYSIYLSHVFALGVVRSLWTRLPVYRIDSTHAAEFLVVGMLSVVAVGVLIFRAVEKPMLTRLQSWYRNFVLATHRMRVVN